MSDLNPVPISDPWPPWPEDLTPERWTCLRADIRRRLLGILGEFPAVIPDPATVRLSAQDCGKYLRIKIVYFVEADDRAPAWILVPKIPRGRLPAVLTMHPSTHGTGKNRVIGLEGAAIRSAPESNKSYALDLVEAGFVVLAPDVWGDGERIPSTGLCRDTRSFYAKHPDWSYMGKIAWDCMRAVDVLKTLPEVDPERIGIAGHSLGALASLFTAAFDDRIKVIVANGSVSAWYEKHQPQHWALDDSDGRINCFIRKLRPYLTLEKWRTIPVQWPEILALMAPRPFLNIQAGRVPDDVDPAFHWAHYAGNHGGCVAIYKLAGARDKVIFLRTNEGHDFPPPARQKMIQWFKEYL